MFNLLPGVSWCHWCVSPQTAEVCHKLFLLPKITLLFVCHLLEECAFMYITHTPTHLRCNHIGRNVSFFCSAIGPTNIDFKLVWLGSFHRAHQCVSQSKWPVFSVHMKTCWKSSSTSAWFIYHGVQLCLVPNSHDQSSPPPSSMVVLQNANSYRSQPPCGQTQGISTTEHSCAVRYQIRSCTKSLQDENMTQEGNGHSSGECQRTCVESASIAVSALFVTAALVLAIVFIVYSKKNKMGQCKSQW